MSAATSAPISPVSIVALTVRKGVLITALKNRGCTWRVEIQQELNEVIAELKRAEKASKQDGAAIQMP